MTHLIMHKMATQQFGAKLLQRTIYYFPFRKEK